MSISLAPRTNGRRRPISSPRSMLSFTLRLTRQHRQETVSAKTTFRRWKMASSASGFLFHATVCTKCKSAKPTTLEFFPPNARKRNGLDSWCLSCRRALAREKQARLRVSNPEKVMAEKRRHRFSEKGRVWKRRDSLIHNHKRRGEALPFRWTHEDWTRCLTFWEQRCAYCGGSPVEQDHVIPLSIPGCPGTVPWNMAPACTKCNRSHRETKIISVRLAAYLDGLRPSG